MSIIGSLPFTLTNGSTADATQVMANFNTIIADVNGAAAENGANSSITSLSGLTTALTVAQGGSGAKTFTLNAVLLGNTTAAFGTVPPGTAGNLLLDNGTTWVGAQTLTGSYSFGVNVAIPAGAGIHSPAANTLCLATGGADRLCVGALGGTYAQTATGGDAGVGSANFASYFLNGLRTSPVRARAFYNGATNTLIGSSNIASVVQNATGDYTFNFTTAFPDANFSAVVSQSNVSGGIAVANRAAGSVRVNAFNTASGAAVDVVVDLICSE